VKIDERNPLAWPEGFPRTKNPTASKFGAHTIVQAINETIRQLELLRAEECTITANAFMRATPADKGAAVYFKLRTGWDSKTNRPILKSYVIPCDKWNKIEHNFWAIAKHIESMRGQQRWGCGSLERDFAGYAALPEKTSPGGAWYEVLGVPPNASKDLVTEAYRQKAKIWHPDLNGGSHEKMAALNQAYETANKILC
jgi:hypothetical protein